MIHWYEKAVFYHIYPLGMTGAEKQNISQAAGDRFKELCNWISHVKRLGCTVIYIGPLFDSSCHGYDTKDFKLVDRRLGSNGEFKEFTRLCHKEGIRVVVDGVFNHTGREFFAFEDILKNREGSAYISWYKNIQFGHYGPAGDGFSYECWQSHPELPSLNLQNKEVTEYLFEAVRFWISEFDVDGIRLDCANVLDFNFMKDLRRLTEQLKEDFWLMGEVIHGDYTQWANPSMLHSVTNYELHKAFYSSHNDHNYFEIAHTVKRQSSCEGLYRDLSMYTFADNHDENRIASKLHDKRHLFPVHTLLFTLPGIPSVYYGSEWGTEGIRSSTSDDELRPYIPAIEIEHRRNELTIHIETLAKIRASNPELYAGSYSELFLTNRQYAFARTGKNTAVITGVNNDSSPSVISVRLPFCPCETNNLLTDGHFALEKELLVLSLNGYGSAVIKIKKG